MRRTYVFAVVGERHVAAVATALKYLKWFSRNNILVLQGRSSVRAPHDQVVEVDLPDELDDRQASIWLKTSLWPLVRGLADQFCYLDSDVIAVNEGVDGVFQYRAGPVNFAGDHVDIDRFSRWAVNCGCTGGVCSHLREAILGGFGVDIPDGGWRLWNGGVFLFDEDSEAFLATWRDMTRHVLSNPAWRARDQGTLAAATWKLGCQHQALLGPEFNLVVDRLWGVPEPRRASATAADFHVRDDYSLREDPSKLRPSFIHFVNGGVGQRGWKHWDEVQALL